jgi:hypothetical protein
LKNASERIQFITDYISAYEAKIKLLNCNGLFDIAKLFELFAIEVGGLYFGKKFKNLNINNSNYPFIDLISEDRQTYIQVSTAKDISSKVKMTLEKINNSDKPEYKTITNVKFFVLDNDSVDKVKDYTGERQIGSIPFSKENDLITTQNIVQKATNDLGFQIELYNLFKKETDDIKDNSYKLQEAIDNSKKIGLGNIYCKINNEYEIDRSELIAQIKSDNHKNISIQGEAGSGKSVACKKLVEGEERLIYARAERFLNETDINNIWGFNIKQTLEMLGNNSITFFIDALEFIADAPAKLEMLSIFYECVQNYSNVKIITSCRTNDKKSFVKIESHYSIYSYEVPDLSTKEQVSIANQYPVIKKMLNANSYVDLLKIPFYINLIVSKNIDVDNISDGNQLRELIWLDIICLKDNKIKKIVEQIVIDRARDFLVGVNSLNYDTEIIGRLISEGIIISDGKNVRLKYDIFEDICFEQYFDNEFDKCKGNYNEFFNTTENLGRSVYRRYQIWISNKLLAKNNREKFLYELVFADKMPLHWQKQTEIGLIKSKFCKEFFDEYGQDIIQKEMISDFIKTTNLYGFEVETAFWAKQTPYIHLRPCGDGRQNLIHLIVENELYKQEKFSKYDFAKLCKDYSNASQITQRAVEETCLILKYFIEENISEFENKEYYNLGKIINALLAPIYQMSEYSKEWIKEFWIKLILFYKSNDMKKERLASDIIADTIGFKYNKLAEHLPIELCAIAEMFWTFSLEDKHSYDGFSYERSFDTCWQYGLSEKAESYELKFTQSTSMDSNFFHALFHGNFWIGLDWAIEFINKAILNFYKGHEGQVSNYEISFIEDGTKENYMASEGMWLATTKEHRMPLVICDLIYCLKETLRDILKNDSIETESIIKFATNVKERIYKKSNNIALLTIISEIGMEFQKELPGFALDLATNIDIILNDLSKFTLITKNPILEMYEENILKIIGMPANMHSDRYNSKEAIKCNLMTYTMQCQISGTEKIKEKCHKIFDYLYSIIPNDKENALYYLQIQKMDLRTAQFEKMDTIIALVPAVTGEAKKIVDRGEKERQQENGFVLELNECCEKIKRKELKLNACLEMINKIVETRKKTDVSGVYDKVLVVFIVTAFTDKALDANTRMKLCQIWIDGIKSCFNNESFIFEYGFSWVLFTQIEKNIGDDIKNQIKKLILDLLLYGGTHGVILEIKRIAELYLATNEKLALSVFNTIIKLAEDEMKHQKFNLDYYKRHIGKSDVDFSPNFHKKFTRVDSFIEKNNQEKYQSKKNDIIESFLYSSSELDLLDFDTSDYDISTLCCSINCGLSLENVTFARIVKKFVITIINIWEATNKTHNFHNIIDIYSLREIIHFFQEQLVEREKTSSIVLDMLFTDIDFSQFTEDTIKFYLNICEKLLVEYFDSHNDKARRLRCEKIILSLERRILFVKEERVKKEFYKALILSVTTFGGLGDWSKCTSLYSYKDKQFLNALFSKYGGFHLRDMLNTIDKLHLDKLLPEILLSVRDAFKYALENPRTRQGFSKIVGDNKKIVLIMITKAFLDFSGKIRCDYELTKAFEEILEMLIALNYEEAATILDEFRVN